MIKHSGLRTDRRSAPMGWPPRGRRLTATVCGLVVGTLVAGRARPVAGRLAVRYGLPAGAVVTAVEVTVPVLVLAAARGIARGSSGPPARREADRGTGTDPRRDPGGMRRSALRSRPRTAARHEQEAAAHSATRTAPVIDLR